MGEGVPAARSSTSRTTTTTRSSTRKVRQELEQGKPIGRDIVAPTDWMAARWIDLGYAEPLDKKNIPNAKNLQPSLADPPYDKNRDFTLPWQSRHHGHRLQPEEDRPRAHERQRPLRPEVQGPRLDVQRVARLGRPRPARRRARTRPTATKDDYTEAIAKIGEETDKGQIRRFTGNDYTKDLASGNLWACVAWSGDLVQLQADNPDLEFLVPEEGGMSWSDNMLMPANESAKGYYGAETFMNYVYDPQVAATIAAYVNYFCPVTGREGDPRRGETRSSPRTS